MPDAMQRLSPASAAAFATAIFVVPALTGCGTTGGDAIPDIAGMAEPPQRPGLPASGEPVASIAFEGASWTLPASANPVLDTIAERLRAGTGRAIVTGGADAGDDEYSRMLGQQRAGEVAGALQKRGIDPERIITFSRGASIGGRRPDRVDVSLVGQ